GKNRRVVCSAGARSGTDRRSASRGEMRRLRRGLYGTVLLPSCPAFLL
ncbi:MAG: hypothetical protein AVDCRST_MAG80-753, partial [uncultured Rubrobacteraceae bacterium]